MPANKPLFVTERNLQKLIESIANSRQKETNNSNHDNTGTVTLLFLGNKRQFYDLLPKNWLLTLPDSMTEEFTDNFFIHFISSIKELQVQFYDLQQQQQLKNSNYDDSTDRNCTNFLIIWGLVTYLEETKYAFFNPIYTVQSINQILYTIFSLLDENTRVIFGESSINVRDPDDERLLLKLFPGPIESSGESAGRKTNRHNMGLAAEVEFDLRLTQNAVKGSDKNMIRVSEVLDRWFQWDVQYSH